MPFLKQPTSLWQATEKTHLFSPGYRTTNLTFTGNPKIFIRAIPTTRHYPNSEETPEPLKPQRSLLPQGFSQSQKTRNRTITGNAITQYTNNYKSLHTLQTNNSNTTTKGIAHLPLLHTRRRTITKTTRTPHRRTTAKRTKPHTPTEKTTHPIHQQK